MEPDWTSMKLDLDYQSIGGNRHPSASEYSRAANILAFGAGHGIALWKPLDDKNVGVHSILNGHTGDVNAVRFLSGSSTGRQVLLSGASDSHIRVWIEAVQGSGKFSCHTVLDSHTASINCVACFPGTTAFASGAADGTIKIWRSEKEDSTLDFKLVQTINLQPKYFPLAIALHRLSETATILVVGGTRSTIQLFKNDVAVDRNFSLTATLTGHEGWIRSLDIMNERDGPESDLLIASASQDKYIRIWRVHCGDDLPKLAPQDDGTRLGSVERSLSSKAQKFDAAGSSYVLSFEALLLGHEDWVYTVQWDRDSSTPRLLSASADSSLSIWEPEPISGVWICNTRLGEISVQKGSTTATGSAGGFFAGLWIHGGKGVTTIGRTGSWRVWRQIMVDGPWKSELGISGHTAAVKGIAWAKDGSYLLSTSSDQTTRVHSEWKQSSQGSWHEISRPQIHGYDLNCIDSINPLQFITGADEKLLRVFDEPSSASLLLRELSGALRNVDAQEHEAASMPVLGLSNKAVEMTNESNGDIEGDITQRELAAPTIPVLEMDHPPYEEDLSRHTLWPEKEKLYGHGYEISAVASSHNGKIVATACKASSIDHAVIRLYETATWRELSPAFKAHSLTVTCLRFNEDDSLLLSVGRDRQWTLFRRGDTDLEYSIFTAYPKGHTRMILSAAWGPKYDGGLPFFATAGRDKVIKLWSARQVEEGVVCKLTIEAHAPVTTIDFLPRTMNGKIVLASGTEAGIVTLSTIDISKQDAWKLLLSSDLDASISPSLSISQVAWKAVTSTTDPKKELLAIASEDNSLRIVSIANHISG